MIFTYNSSAVFPTIFTVGGSHDSGAFLSIYWFWAIFVHTIDSNSVNAIHIAIVCTAVSMAAISDCKRVDGTQATTTLWKNYSE